MSSSQIAEHLDEFADISNNLSLIIIFPMMDQSCFERTDKTFQQVVVQTVSIVDHRWNQNELLHQFTIAA
jgi:hypothetical protein